MSQPGAFNTTNAAGNLLKLFILSCVLSPHTDMLYTLFGTQISIIIFFFLSLSRPWTALLW